METGYNEVYENDAKYDGVNEFGNPAENDVSILQKTEEAPELSFEEKVIALEQAVTKHPLNCEVLCRILSFCKDEERVLCDIEQDAAQCPQFKLATQNQYHMICTLERFYGLERIERDENGEAITPERTEGLTEDEIDDLIWDICFKTTDVGKVIVEKHDPLVRIQNLFDAEPSRIELYQEVLAFIAEAPRTYGEIQGLLRGRPELTTDAAGEHKRIQPSVFVDKLERAGALVWIEKWKITDEGRHFLEGA